MSEHEMHHVVTAVAVPVDAAPTSESRYSIAHDPASNTPILVRTVDGNVQGVVVLRPPQELLERFATIAKRVFVSRRNMATGANTNPETLLEEALREALATVTAEYGAG